MNTLFYLHSVYEYALNLTETWHLHHFFDLLKDSEWKKKKDLIYPISTASVLLLQTQNASRQEGRPEFYFTGKTRI